MPGGRGADDAAAGSTGRAVAEKTQAGMSIGDLAKYLMVSRQNLSGLIGRMERDGHVAIAPDGQDRRSRIVTMTKSGRHLWQVQALPKIYAYDEEILGDFSVNDATHVYCTTCSRCWRACSASISSGSASRMRKLRAFRCADPSPLPAAR